MRIVKIQENRSLFIDIVNSNQTREKKDRLLRFYEILLKGKPLENSDSLIFIRKLEKLFIKFSCHPMEELEENILIEIEENKNKKTSDFTKLKQLEEIFGKTICSRSELNTAYRQWASKNHPDRFQNDEQVRLANKRCQYVHSLLN